MCNKRFIRFKLKPNLTWHFIKMIYTCYELNVAFMLILLFHVVLFCGEKDVNLVKQQQQVIFIAHKKKSSSE